MKLFILLAGVLFSLNSFATPGTHGMVLFGEESVFAYHLPMFHKIHAQQVVIKLAPSAELKKQLLSLVKDQLVTFVPEPFDLDLFVKNPHPLVGDVYSGHFEKDGVVILGHVTLPVESIMYHNSIIHDDEVGAEFHYLLVSEKTNHYLLHLLLADPEIDQIFNVTSLQAGCGPEVTATKILTDNESVFLKCSGGQVVHVELGKKIFEDSVM